jgi:translation initiation factor 6 (eIF-6)
MMTSERKEILRARLARFHAANNEGPTATGRELIQALDEAEARIQFLESKVRALGNDVPCIPLEGSK